MGDQADNLRVLVHTATPAAPVEVAGPPMIVVTGGRAGVGATTVAANLAAVLADGRERVLLVDAAQQRPKLAEIAGVRLAKIDHWLSDVLGGKCTAGDALVSGPSGTMLLAARSRVSPKHECQSRRASPTWQRHAQQRLFAELQSLHNEIDLVVIDIGSGLTPWTRRFWLRAQLVVLVTTSEGQSLLDSYATIKRSVADALGPDLRVVVNRCENDRTAAGAQQRLSDACQRFLGRGVQALPSLPSHVVYEADGNQSAPRVWEAPNSPFGHAALWLGRGVGEALACGDVRSCATACGPPERIAPLRSTAR